MPRRSATQAVPRRKKAPTLVPERITTLAYTNPVKIAVMSLFSQLAERASRDPLRQATGLLNLCCFPAKSFISTKRPSRVSASSNRSRVNAIRKQVAERIMPCSAIETPHPKEA